MIRASRVLALCLLVSIAIADELSWKVIPEDKNGNYIDRDDIIVVLYWGYSNSEWNYAGPMGESPVSFTNVAPGCYYLALIAVRTDTDPYMASPPSDIVHYCTPGEAPPIPPTDVGTD
jgi:hypothetical protein